MTDYADRTIAALREIQKSTQFDYDFDLVAIKKKPVNWPFIHIDVLSKGTVICFFPSYMENNNPTGYQGSSVRPTEVMDKQLNLIESVTGASFALCEYGVVRKVSGDEASVSFRRAVDVVKADFYKNEESRRFCLGK